MKKIFRSVLAVLLILILSVSTIPAFSATETDNEIMPGDINGDKKVNSKDATRLMQYLAHWDVEVDEALLDVNGDDKVNSKDASRLMQYLAHWDVDIYPVVPAQREYEINYSVYGDDPYLQTLTINNPNPVTYDSSQGVTRFSSLHEPGYLFEGWYDSPDDDGTPVEYIPAGTTGDITLYAHWSKIVYDVTYQMDILAATPITDEAYTRYTTDTGIETLPEPSLYGYIFLGWLNDRNQIVTSIPAGSTGNITLKAYWTSQRNLARTVDEPQEPILLNDTDNGIQYYAYPIGTVENIPLTDGQAVSTSNAIPLLENTTLTDSITESDAQRIARTISGASVDSRTWTLSEDWNSNTAISEEWCYNIGMTMEEAHCLNQSSAGGYFVTENGRDAIDFGNNIKAPLDSSDSPHYYGHIDSFLHLELITQQAQRYQTTVSADSSPAVYEISGADCQRVDYSDRFIGTDTCAIDTDVSPVQMQWNLGSMSTEEVSSDSFIRAFSSAIDDAYGYAGSDPELATQTAFVTSQNDAVNAKSILRYSTAQIEMTTHQYSSDGKPEGCYRVVPAGTAHVFGVVGYNAAERSFFTFTYSVMDDDVYDYLDYAPDYNFNDRQNSVLPFEIPFDVCENTVAEITSTDGIRYRTNTSNHTAIVIRYNGDNADVIVPAYISSGGTAYKVTGISSAAFAGKPVRSVKLGKYIDEIPAAAFEDCSSLQEIAGYFTKIGNSAFSGCTALRRFTVSSAVTQIGENAFNDVPDVIRPTSDWIPETELPEGVTVTGDEKWTYDQTTYTTSSSYPGYGYVLCEDEPPQYGPWGPWISYSGIHFDVIDDTTEYRTIEIPAVMGTEYNYSKWTQYSNGTGKSGPSQGYCGGIYCNYYFERGWGSQLSALGVDNQGVVMYTSNGSDVWYNETSREYTITPARYEYYYRTREKYCVYKLVTAMESDTEVTESDEVSNIVKWVKYYEC